MATTTRQQPPKPKPRPSIPSPKKPAAPAGKSNHQPPSGSGFYGTPAISVFCYGPSGVGKTSMWSYMPDPMFIIDPQEEGIEDLVRFKQAAKPKHPTIIVPDFEEAIATLESVAEGEYDGIKSVVLDSVTGFEKLCFQYHCREYFENDWTKGGFYSFQQGPKNAAKTDWPRFLDACDTVRRAGINVIVIGHSQVKSYTNPEGPDYDQFIPYLDKETWQQTHRWAKAVIFYNHNVSTEKQGLRTKAKTGSEERFLYTTHSATYAAKNRWGLEPVIDAGMSGKDAFHNFLKAYRKAAS